MMPSTLLSLTAPSVLSTPVFPVHRNLTLRVPKILQTPLHGRATALKTARVPTQKNGQIPSAYVCVCTMSYRSYAICNQCTSRNGTMHCKAPCLRQSAIIILVRMGMNSARVPRLARPSSCRSCASLHLTMAPPR